MHNRFGCVVRRVLLLLLFLFASHVFFRVSLSPNDFVPSTAFYTVENNYYYTCALFLYLKNFTTSCPAARGYVYACACMYARTQGLNCCRADGTLNSLTFSGSMWSCAACRKK